MNGDNDDNDLFLQEMGDVRRLQAEKKVALKRHSVSDETQRARREAATRESVADDNYLSGAHVEMLDPYYQLEFKRPGVQQGVFRKLKQGRYSQEARLDLHRMTVDRARQEVFDFIKECVAYDLRSLIIIHGKGSHSRSGQGSPETAQLKSYVNKWLPELAQVQAFCSARPQHGGVGAVYVLLSKSEAKKQENRDRLNRGRSGP